MFNKTRITVTIIYFLGMTIISVFKEVKTEFYLYSIGVFFIVGIMLILLKKLIEIFEEFDKYERLVFAIAHPLGSVAILLGKYDSVSHYIGTYLGILLFSSMAYLILSSPYRLRSFFFEKRD